MKLWIARDKDGELCLYGNKPELVKIEENTIHEFWQDSSIDGYYCYLNNNEFSEITFENSPQEIELRLEKENIVKILKAYDNIFGLSDGGIARSDEDIEHAADVILKSLKENNL